MSDRQRLLDIQRFYSLLDQLEARVGRARLLADCDGRVSWPPRGVYFFFEPGESRTNSGEGPRVVRIGTHALKAGSKATLWGRLSQHKGSQRSGGGNHRGSIFRGHVGSALAVRDHWSADVAASWWSVRQSAPRAIREREHPLECAVSAYIGQMPFLWLEIDDASGPGSLRGYMERNAIALLSNAIEHEPVDPASSSWLGHHARAEAIRHSGLWNVDHIHGGYEPGFLDVLEALVDR